MKNKKNNFLFNFIAPVYALFYKSQKKTYTKDINILGKYIDITSFTSIIDIGCGTGAMCAAFNEKIQSVTGVDPAVKMLNIGKKKKENKDITFVECNTCATIPFKDKSFDLSVASFVAHGIKPSERQTLYTEMSRLSKHYVLYYDYNEKRSIITSIVEWFEGGDYFNFIKTVKKELNNSFLSVEEIKLDKSASWYICKPNN